MNKLGRWGTLLCFGVLLLGGAFSGPFSSHLEAKPLKTSLYQIAPLSAFSPRSSSQAPRANSAAPTPQIPHTQPVTMMESIGIMVTLALLPFAMILFSSYIKTAIVLSLLRNALGVQQAPPSQVLNGVALILSIFVMFPTGAKMFELGNEVMEKYPPSANVLSQDSVPMMQEVFLAVREPMRSFLEKNSLRKHIKVFWKLAVRSFPGKYGENCKPTDFIVLMPSFISTQLKAAFEIGVLIYLPFFVIDLVTANILLAMGMMMLSPLTISLPLKLLLLVSLDGWTALMEGLVISFY